MLLSKFTRMRSNLCRSSFRLWSVRRYCKVLEESTTENKQNIKEQYITLNFITAKNGNKYQIKALVGQDIMQSVGKAGYYKEFDEFGFCGGNRYCTSCHVMFEPEIYKTLPQMCTNEKKYLSFLTTSKKGLSRLGCHIDVTKEMDGTVLVIPARQDDDEEN